MRRKISLFLVVLLFLGVLFGSNWTDRMEIIKTVSTGGDSYHLELIESRGWIAISDWHNAVVRLFDFELNQLFTVGVSTPRGLLYDESNGYLYVASYGSTNLQVIDLDQRKVIRSLSTGDYPINMAQAKDGKLYVVNHTGDSITIIDTNTLQLIKTISVGSRPYGIDYDPVQNLMYITLNNAQQLIILDCATEEIVKKTVGQKPLGVQVLPGNRVAVANLGESTIYIVDLSSFQTLKVIDFPAPTYLWLQRDGYHLFVSSNDRLGVINLNTYQIVREIPIGSSSHQLKTTSDGRFLFYVNHGQKLVGKIDTHYMLDPKNYFSGELPHYSSSHYLERGKRAYFESDWNKARANFLQALQIAAFHDTLIRVDAHQYLARIALEEENREKAREHYELAFEIDPSNYLTVSTLIEDFYWNDPNAGKVLQDMAGKLEATNNLDLIQYASIIRLRFKEAGYEDALMKNIGKAVTFAPEFIEPLINALKKQDAKAVRSLYGDYVRLVKENPTNYIANYVAGFLDFQENRPISAVDRLSTSFGLNPSNHFAFFLVGILKLPETFEDGRDALKKAIEMVPIYPKYYIELAKAYLDYYHTAFWEFEDNSENSINHLSNAIEMAESGVSINPFDGTGQATLQELYDELLKVLYGLEMNEDTLVRITQAIERYLPNAPIDEKAALLRTLKEYYSKLIVVYSKDLKVQKASNLVDSLEKRFKGEFIAYNQMKNSLPSMANWFSALKGKQVLLYHHADGNMSQYDKFVQNFIKLELQKKEAVFVSLNEEKTDLQQLDEELLEEQMEMIRQISSEEKIDAILWITSNLVSPTELQTKIFLLSPESGGKQSQQFVVQPDYSIQGFIQ